MWKRVACTAVGGVGRHAPVVQHRQLTFVDELRRITSVLQGEQRLCQDQNTQRGLSVTESTERLGTARRGLFR